MCLKGTIQSSPSTCSSASQGSTPDDSDSDLAFSVNRSSSASESSLGEFFKHGLCSICRTLEYWYCVCQKQLLKEQFTQKMISKLFFFYWNFPILHEYLPIQFQKLYNKSVNTFQLLCTKETFSHLSNLKSLLTYSIHFMIMYITHQTNRFLFYFCCVMLDMFLLRDVGYVSFQWRPPALLWVHQSHRPSPHQTHPWATRTMSVQCALIMRWIPSSTRVDTCVCVMTAGWGSRDRIMLAVPSVADP